MFCSRIRRFVGCAFSCRTAELNGECPRQGLLVLFRVDCPRFVGRWMKENGDAIYGTAPGDIGDGKTVVSTRKGEFLFKISLADGKYPVVEREIRR